MGTGCDAAITRCASLAYRYGMHRLRMKRRRLSHGFDATGGRADGLVQGPSGPMLFALVGGPSGPMPFARIAAT
ncbi:hypothetical protein GLE_3304 [Lysobacter enzymogenes]|uniref:Uncharacterized protein n=1 Tax=Lysobacter enzymogenes TaxID=69 RepID=A0A0S2DJD4_LYSEN|nr:hypothetical protein GLE_3304 [Lysobacter enzymogenes]